MDLFFIFFISFSNISMHKVYAKCYEYAKECLFSEMYFMSETKNSCVWLQINQKQSETWSFWEIFSSCSVFDIITRQNLILWFQVQYLTVAFSGLVYFNSWENLLFSFVYWNCLSKSREKEKSFYNPKDKGGVCVVGRIHYLVSHTLMVKDVTIFYSFQKGYHIEKVLLY